MKKILFVMPFMAISLLASCNNGGGGNPGPTPPGPTPGATYTINTPIINNGSIVGTAPTSIKTGETVDFVFQADNWYAVPYTISVNGATFNYKRSGSQGTITLSNPTSNVTIADITCIVTFTSDTWENVTTYANQGLSKLHEVYKADCDNNESRPGTLIGLERTIAMFGNSHIVKVIDENHDKLSADTTKFAALTFDFTTYICNGEGNPTWCWWDDDITDVWSTSQLREFLSQILNESFPNIIRNNVKTVKKQTYDTASSQNVEYDETLFPLTVKEMGYAGSTYDKETTAPYEYYKSATSDTDNLRRKKLLNGSYPVSWSPYPYWFRSPCVRPATTDKVYRFLCRGDNGFIDSDECTDMSVWYIAPAFCI